MYLFQYFQFSRRLFLFREKLENRQNCLKKPWIFEKTRTEGFKNMKNRKKKQRKEEFGYILRQETMETELYQIPIQVI